MRITCLAENTSGNPICGCEHGLSLYIESNGKKILFDTGAGGLFAENADKLGINLASVDYAVLSHGHYDHGGGLRRFLELNDHAPVYANENVFGCFIDEAKNNKYIGLDQELKNEPRIILIGDHFAPGCEQFASGSDHLLSDGNQPVPGDDHLLSDGNQPVPGDDHLLSDGNQPVPGDDHLLSDGNQLVPDRAQLLHDGHQLIPDDDQSTPRDNQLIPAEIFSFREKKQRWPVISGSLAEVQNGVHAPETFRHEQYLLLREDGKTVLVSGCSHRGILNLMSWCAPDILVGGFHLFKLDPLGEDAGILEETARELTEYGTRYYTCHCTGVDQYLFLKERMGERLSYLACGDVLEI